MNLPSSEWYGPVLFVMILAIWTWALFDDDRVPHTWTCVRSDDPARSYERETTIEGSRFLCRREYE